MGSPDDERFRRLFDEHFPAILSFALRRCHDSGDAADIAAETFLTAWRKLDQIPVGEERPWLFGVARRVVSNHRRGHLRRSRLADRLRTELTTTTSAPSLASYGPADDVARAMASLAERDQEILKLTAWDGLTPAEIAIVLRIPAVTVRSRLMRARTRLTAALDERRNDPLLLAPTSHDTQDAT